MLPVPAGLEQILDLERIEDFVFRGRSRPVAETREFGGEVAGQALIAAARTVAPERTVHSLHAYFLRPGDPGRPIGYQVDPIRDGRSFTTRRVVGVQHGEPIFTLSASFQVTEPGVHHQVPELSVPDPALHACAATYVSDLMLLAAALLPHRLMFGNPRLQMASLDHAV
jgi:acyl-CoA thioesterase II